MKLVVAKYDSDDAPGKVIDFYRDKLKKYGKVIECHTSEPSGAHAEINDDEHSKELKCEGDNAGPVTELKVGHGGQPARSRHRTERRPQRLNLRPGLRSHSRQAR